MKQKLVAVVTDREMISDLVQDMENLSVSEVIARWSYRLDVEGARDTVDAGRLPYSLATHYLESRPYSLQLWDTIWVAALWVDAD